MLFMNRFIEKSHAYIIFLLQNKVLKSCSPETSSSETSAVGSLIRVPPKFVCARTGSDNMCLHLSEYASRIHI